MIALYRCGRQTEALAVYHSARKTLVEELGIEPSPDLKRVERAILQQDISLDVPAITAIEAERPSPVAAAHPGC